MKNSKVEKLVNLKMMSNRIYFDTLKNAGGSFSINKQKKLKTGKMLVFFYTPAKSNSQIIYI